MKTEITRVKFISLVEVTAFFELLNKGLTPEYAFTRLTGKDPNELTDIRLEIVLHFKEESEK